MFLRITKYNPMYRNDKGFYEKDEWTSFSDIGMKFDNEELTLQKYLETESAYSNAIIILMKDLNVFFLKLINLRKETYENLARERDNDLESFFYTLKNNQNIGIEQIPNILKLFMREMIGGKLFSEELEIHFGDDYYMYAVSKHQSEKSIAQIKKTGLFVENFKSPYLDE